MKKHGIPEDKIWEFIEHKDYLGNLQLLEGLPNQEKSGKHFNEWLTKTYKTKDERSDYLRKNYIPDMDYDLKNFLKFFEKREKFIKDLLKNLLVTN